MSAVGDVPWAVHDEKLMNQWADPSLELEDIATALGRSVAAVKTRASRLRLPRRLTNKQLARMYGVAVEDLASVTDALRGGSDEIAQRLTGGDEVSCLARLVDNCMEKFRSPDKSRIRICPRCKDSQEYQGASSLPDGKL